MSEVKRVEKKRTASAVANFAMSKVNHVVVTDAVPEVTSSVYDMKPLSGIESHF